MVILAIALCLIEIGLFLYIAQGQRRLGNLTEVSGALLKDAPPVSVIVPACNEAQTIGPALETLLAQEYAGLEIIVVNDRSTDATGEVLREVQLAHPQLVVLDIHQLPDGWLGKHHALHCGAAAARGDVLLFTDADIHMEPTTVSRAVRRLQEKGLDHLCLLFRNSAGGWLLNALILDAGSGLLLLFRPWLAADPCSPRFMGVGAFNMVRRAAYERIGGHATISMHPIDDIMLGRLIKEAGLRQECLVGYDFVTVRWYESVADMIRGLMKNVFALVHFRTTLALAGVAGVVVLTILPQWGALLGQGQARFVFATAVLMRMVFFGQAARHSGLSCWLAPASLLTPYLTVYTVLRAVVLTLKNRGISWRGSHYPLDELRRRNRSVL